MSTLSDVFEPYNAVRLDVTIPPLALQILARFSAITNAPEICIAGGFLRGLYMQQVLGLTPLMNDIDIFANMALPQFEKIKGTLEEEFGTPFRFHIGQFKINESPRGLIEFVLPDPLREYCSGVASVQLNFGILHPWANPENYIRQANIGINQIAATSNGDVIASQSFISDMTNRTMTMNVSRPWSVYDWDRTTKSIARMQAERPEFSGWKIITAPKPYSPINGQFWENHCNKPLIPPILSL